MSYRYACAASLSPNCIIQTKHNMTTQKNSLNSQNHHAHQEGNSNYPDEIDSAVNNFIRLYNLRTAFFSDSFIRKVKDGNRKALAELLRQPVPPTLMDLRPEFLKCLQANVLDEHRFRMKDGKVYTMQELKRLVPEWSSIAEKALIESDPALADKLMSLVQWNAKAAFEVTFSSAMNELRDIRKTKKVTGDFEHYMKWIILPLEKSLENVKAVNPPGNALVGYGDRIPLREAIAIAENVKYEFQRILAGRII
jgi:hypothetical protein